MSYSSYETSIETGGPVELYLFSQGTQSWGFTSGADPITRFGLTYEPIAVSRNRIKQTPDIFKDSLSLSFPRDTVFAQQFLGFAPDEPTTISILRGHYGDIDEEYIVYWKGRVVGAKATANTIDLDCESIFTSIRRPGLRAKFELSCRHTLYMTGCNVDKEAYRFDGSVTSINGQDVVIAGADGQTDGYYTGGMIVSESGLSRFIVSHTGNTIRMSKPFGDISNGDTVALYPGCDHLKSTCNSKFSNLDNFGGFPFIPVKNPFGGTSIA